MTTPWPVRWRDTTLTPHVLRYVPEGYRHVDRLGVALAMGRTAFDILPPVRAEHFRTMWKVALKTGWQPNGLMILVVNKLPKPEGHDTGITSKRFAAFCRRQMLWQHVPGGLHPKFTSDMPGCKPRAYLIIAPTCRPRGARR